LNLVPRIVSLLFFGFYHAGTLITSGTVFGGKVTGPSRTCYLCVSVFP